MNILKELENVSREIDNWYGGLDEPRDTTMDLIMEYAKKYHKEQLERNSEPATNDNTSENALPIKRVIGCSTCEFKTQSKYSEPCYRCKRNTTLPNNYSAITL